MLHLSKGRPALLVGAPSPPHIVRIEQAIVPRNRLPLNAPLAMDQLVAPELLPAKRSPGDIQASSPIDGLASFANTLRARQAAKDHRGNGSSKPKASHEPIIAMP